MQEVRQDYHEHGFQGVIHRVQDPEYRGVMRCHVPDHAGEAESEPPDVLSLRARDIPRVDLSDPRAEGGGADLRQWQDRADRGQKQVDHL